jgi:radical SAM superfamily enzyme YgiQ (UPF0313 family)
MGNHFGLIRCNYDSKGSGAIASLALGYLSSYLKAHGHQTLIIDGLRDKFSNAEILKILQKNNAKAAGITCMSFYYNDVIALSKYLKENGIKIVIGGIHPTFLPYQTLLDSGADYVCCGEGERALLELVNNNMSNKLDSGKTIKGIYSLEELSSETTPFEKADIVENLDDIPFPDWEQLAPASKKYSVHSGELKKYPAVGIFTTRGCPFPCKFCAAPNFYNKRIRTRSPENVIREIKLLTGKFGIKEIQFLDDNITLRREHIESICKLIISENIKIECSTPNGIRADTIDDDIVKLMKKAGWYMTALGIESANETVLKNIKKSETIAEIKNAILILQKNRIEVTGFFILGLPGDTKETIQETIDFAFSSKLNRIGVAIFNVIPGSDYWTELAGRFQPDFAKSDVYNPIWTPEGITAEELKTLHANAVRRFYFNPRQILYSISKLTINNFSKNIILKFMGVILYLFPALRKKRRLKDK